MTDNLDENDFEAWLRAGDPPDELSVPEAAWDAAVETAFDPSYELTTDLTAAPGPDPLDSDGDSESDPDVGGFDDPPADDVTGDHLASGLDEDDDVFSGSEHSADDSFDDGALDDDF
ncbi:hypothetical protein [Gordonia terrae]|jgi:hypothetical protein|uniref:Uncharacterized protein n=2 Tax=Gordonia terrae TaxID=2055 RepID=A0AAD0K7D4_9ACTN|nr:hypothetical protein [Gordonia terrae]VTR06730.1 Uncharacterised protein [Clostridioides difficile]ANY22450.1 hypothetical protein BCM27_06180 [Gordonia terrae]AWO83188.1 hypothetical protein DLJ61_06230 [Gordonia terrae]UPW10364.1 hypothetical protein M1C59_05825 [Gordonia terrae]VTS34782.1 Uncharacterised protein [Gordonia terrae]